MPKNRLKRLAKNRIKKSVGENSAAVKTQWKVSARRLLTKVALYAEVAFYLSPLAVGVHGCYQRYHAPPSNGAKTKTVIRSPIYMEKIEQKPLPPMPQEYLSPLRSRSEP